MPIAKSGANLKTPTHEITLSDGIETWGFRVRPGDVQETTLTPSTLLSSKEGGKYGDWEPGFSHVEQRDWVGGRGLEDLSRDNTGFYDSKNAWTMTDGCFFPAPYWHYADTPSGSTLVNGGSYESAPGSVKWRPLTGTTTALAVAFTTDNTLTPDYLWAWVRRVGWPGTLTAALYTQVSSAPGALVTSGSGTKATSSITDTVSVWCRFDILSCAQLSTSTPYWFVIYGASTDTEQNHWEIGVDTSLSTAKMSSSMSEPSWSTASPQGAPHYRVSGGHRQRRWHFFELEGALYAVDQCDDGTAPNLFINGDRGNADANTGALTTLVDATKTWTADQWIGAVAKIVAGPGLGEYRTITDSTTTTLTVDPAWDTEHTTSSRYVILGSPHWNILSTTGLTKPVTDVCVYDNIVLFAQGSGAYIRKMYDNAGTHTYGVDGTNYADLLHTFYDPTDGPVVWRAINGTTCQVSRGSVIAWNATTGITFGTGIDIGDHSHPMTKLLDYNDQLWIMKEDGVWSVKTDKASRLNIGLEAVPDAYNGLAACSQNLYLYFSWWNTLERLYGATVDDIGPWKGAGLPKTRAGHISAIEPVVSWLFVAIDAGLAGYSSILCWDGRGWHELWRCDTVGLRIRSLKWAPTPDGKPRLWWDVWGELHYMEFPANSLNPLTDTTFNYHHEAVVVSAPIDMGAAVLPKAFRELSIVSRNLTSRSTTSTHVAVEYQVDDEIVAGDLGSDAWVIPGSVWTSPVGGVSINEGGRKKLRYRLRGITENRGRPPIVDAVVVEAFARTPSKRQWTLRFKIGDLRRNRRGGSDADPDDLYLWLLATARRADLVRMRSSWARMDDVLVAIEPPTLLRTALNTIQQWWAGTITLTVREV